MTEQDITQTVELVAAYVSHNALAPSALPDLIASVHKALTGLGKPPEVVEASGAPVPAVSIKHSVKDDHLVCLEDGLKFKSLKRHLQASFGMSPQQYREKWGLPKTYPMVAPAYAKARSNLAKTLGLGRQRVVASLPGSAVN